MGQVTACHSWVACISVCQPGASAISPDAVRYGFLSVDAIVPDNIRFCKVSDHCFSVGAFAPLTASWCVARESLGPSGLPQRNEPQKAG